MPVAHLLGMGDQRLARIGGFSPKVLASNTCLIGLRDLDEDEKRVIKESGVRTFTMKDIDRHGIGKVFETAVRYACEGTAGYHLSCDIDVVDPSVAMGTGTPSRGGLSYREAHYLMELASDSNRLLSLDLVEVNPLEDTQNRTAELACELILSALGKSIL
jgi:arginase